jgi:hypothetical protein
MGGFFDDIEGYTSTAVDWLSQPLVFGLPGYAVVGGGLLLALVLGSRGGRGQRSAYRRELAQAKASLRAKYPTTGARLRRAAAAF